MSEHYIDRSNDEEIIDIIRSILNNGQMKVETFNESILVALMERRGTPINYAESFRNIERDYKYWVNESHIPSPPDTKKGNKDEN